VSAKKWLAKEVIKDLYYGKDLTLAQVAEALDVCALTLRREMIRHGLKVKRPDIKSQLTREVLYQKHIVEGKTTTEIAREFELKSPMSVVQALRRHQFPIQKRGHKCERTRKQQSIRRYEGCGDLSGRYWGSLRRDAERRGIPFEITIQEAWDLFVAQAGRCALSGREIVLCRSAKEHVQNKDAHTASLDRIDPKKWYFKDNIQWIHKSIQKMKWAFDEEYFIAMCRAIAEHRT
jgi:hypothetical protein